MAFSTMRSLAFAVLLLSLFLTTIRTTTSLLDEDILDLEPQLEYDYEEQAAYDGVDEGIAEESAEVDVPEVVSNNEFAKLFGSTLYTWNKNADGKTQEINEAPTEDLLKGKTVVGVYFSASWCGPCKQFTPALADFYREMNKKTGGKFEVIWVSRDQSADAFVDYYQHMPWLAVPLENLEKANALGPMYNLKGIPHLVILDGYDASVYTLEGRMMVAKDKYGLEFPWAPRTFMTALPKPLQRLIKGWVKSTKTKVKSLVRGVLEGFMPPSILVKMGL